MKYSEETNRLFTGPMVNYFQSDSGMSQSKIANKIGVNRASISRWIKHGYIPTLEHFLKFVIITRTPISSFFEGDFAIRYTRDVCYEASTFTEISLKGHSEIGMIIYGAMNAKMIDFKTLFQILENVDPQPEKYDPRMYSVRNLTTSLFALCKSPLSQANIPDPITLARICFVLGIDFSNLCQQLISHKRIVCT